MDGEADALALDDARIEDSVTCEGCGATFDVAEIVESPYEADDGGAYCIECAEKEWARTVEEAARYKAALREIERNLGWYVGDRDARASLQQIITDALAPAAGEGDDGDR